MGENFDVRGNEVTGECGINTKLVIYGARVVLLVSEIHKVTKNWVGSCSETHTTHEQRN